MSYAKLLAITIFVLGAVAACSGKPSPSGSGAELRAPDIRSLLERQLSRNYGSDEWTDLQIAQLKNVGDDVVALFSAAIKGDRGEGLVHAYRINDGGLALGRVDINTMASQDEPVTIHSMTGSLNGPPDQSVLITGGFAQDPRVTKVVLASRAGEDVYVVDQKSRSYLDVRAMEQGPDFLSLEGFDASGKTVVKSWQLHLIDAFLQ